MPILRWEKPPEAANPPPPGSQATQWDDAAIELRVIAGVWGVIYEGPMVRVAGLVSAIRGGKRRCWAPAGAYEAQQVGLGGREVTVYARYVGDEAEDGAQ